VRDASGSTVYLYRIPDDNPLAWVASGAVRASDEQSQPTILDPRFDSRRAALVDTLSTIRLAADAASLTSSTISARVASYKPGGISIDLSAPAPDGAVLVVSENYFPGWQARSGGSTLPTSRANYNLIGVGLSKGTQHVDLTFADPAYGPGKLLTFIALFIAIAAVAAGVVLDRRLAPTPAAV
jgi:hypothetical protein